MTSSTLVFDLEGDRLLAVEAKTVNGKARVLRAVNARRDESTSSGDDPETIGGWIRVVLDEHGLRAKNAIFSVSRGEVLIKHLDAPVGTLSSTERHEMVHLQMARQASLTSADNVIDYIALDDDSEAGGAVIAAAMPAERVQWRREVAAAAGLKLAGIRLRSAGIRAMLARPEEDRDPALVIAPGLGSIELLVIASGRLVFSRSIDTPLPTTTKSRELDHFAERVAVEASRTWMSYRVSPEGEDVQRLVVLAAEPLASAVADAASDRLEMPPEVITPSDLLDADEGIDPQTLTPAVPLAGLLLCRHRRVPVLDFANPTPAPDTRAKLRQAVLAGVFVLVVLAGAGYLFAQQRLSQERAVLETLRRDNEAAQNRYIEAQLTGARIGHMWAWSEQPIDWYAHLTGIIENMPDPTQSALAELGVELNQQVVFRSGAQLNDPSAWSTRPNAVFRVAGMVRDRAHAQAFRQRLLDEGIYSVVSQGPEVDDRFALQIVTESPSADRPTQIEGEGP